MSDYGTDVVEAMLRDELDETKARVAELEKALRAVEELHPRRVTAYPQGDPCATCHNMHGHSVNWPCEHARIVKAALPDAYRYSWPRSLAVS